MLWNGRNEYTLLSDYNLVFMVLQILNKERWDFDGCNTWSVPGCDRFDHRTRHQQYAKYFRITIQY